MISTISISGIGIEMERLAASMGGTIKWPYNDSECLDADFFKVGELYYSCSACACSLLTIFQMNASIHKQFPSPFPSQVVADHLVTSSGIRPLLHSYAVDVIMDGDTIKVW